MNINWPATKVVSDWLDEEVSGVYKDQPLAQDWARISKVAEELGEAIQAFIGYTGQNPRKGVTHTKEQVLKELADTALTAIYAMVHFTGDEETARYILCSTQFHHHRRIGIEWPRDIEQNPDTTI